MAVSQSTAAALEDIGVAPERIRVVPNGVDPAPARDHCTHSGEQVFVALGRLVGHKRIDLLLEAWERVRPACGGRLLIAGNGPERARLSAMAGDAVEFLGRVDEEGKRRLLADASVLLHPALHEGWGVVIMEAAAMGTPALGFDVPGVRNAIVDDKTGVLVSSVDAFVWEWIALATDADRRNRLGEAARLRAASFSWEATVEGFLAVAAEAVS
jgi:glycosyltransferase involved in cell wall biosynthesis